MTSRRTLAALAAASLLAAGAWAQTENPFGGSSSDNPFGAPPEQDSPFDGAPAGGSPFDTPPDAAGSPFGDPASPVDSPFGEAEPFPANGATPAPTTASPFGDAAPAAPGPDATGRSPWDIVRSPSEFPQRARPEISTNFAARGLQREASILFSGSRPVGPVESSLVPRGEVRWAPSLAEAKAMARESSRPVLVVFTSDGQRSRDFLERVARDPDVAAAMAFYIPVQLDFDQNPGIAQAHHVPRAPYAVVLDSFGFARAHLSGLDDRDRTLRGLRRNAGI